jgi:SAM-dependent methyltransferase
VKLDLTKADTGRIVDYWLGGSHNFEVDRTAAAKIEAFTPSAPDWVRAQRAFLQRAVRHMAESAGIDHFLVAGAGLPTCGNVHEVAPNAQVVYTDISPVTIAYGQNILANTPRVRYLYGNATRLHELSPQQPGNNGAGFAGQRVGLVYVGVAYFFADETLRQTVRALYDLVGTGSLLAVSFIGRDAEQHAPESLRAYDQMGNHIYTRTPDEIRAVLQPWQTSDDGIQSAPTWGESHPTSDSGPVFVYGTIGEKSSR